MHFFFSSPVTARIYTLSLHDALPISAAPAREDMMRSDSIAGRRVRAALTLALLVPWIAGCEGGGRQRSRASRADRDAEQRSEEHTSELQSHSDLVCRLLLEKKTEGTK